MYLKKIKIGNVELRNNIMLAPMAGITDLPFRTICEKYGAGLTCTEMVSSKGLFYDDGKTKLLLDVEGEHRPVAAQIFGSDLNALKYASEYVSNIVDIVDINMGCPAPKIVKNGDGSKLLLDLELLGNIAKTVVDASKVPVTAKIRKGWDKDNIVAIEAARILEEAGVAAITVHGRTREQYYAGVADWEIIRQVKEAVSIPVIGNGDVDSPERAKALVEQTGCDGIMIGRASRGNPWIFSRIQTYLETGEIPPQPSAEEVREMILRHARLQIEYKGEYTGMREMRKHVAWYTAGMPHSAAVRREVNEVETYEQLERLVKDRLES